MKEQLIQYGLTEKETIVYLYLVENTESSAYSIGKGIRMPRATVYLTLENLKSKGLISVSKKNNISLFACESLNRIKNIALEKISLADILIPQLRNLATLEKFNPTTKLYVGTEGMKNVFEDMLETLKEKKLKQLYTISDSSIVKALPKYFPEWVKRREKIGVFTKMLGEKEDAFPFPSNSMRETRFFPANIVFDCSINIYGDKIACLSIKGKEIYSVVVESPTLAHTMRQMFFLVWESLGSK